MPNAQKPSNPPQVQTIKHKPSIHYPGTTELTNEIQKTPKSITHHRTNFVEKKKKIKSCLNDSKFFGKKREAILV
jgi:hypothetical protein